MSVLDWIRNQKTPSDLGRIVSNVAKFTPFAATAGVYDAYTNKKQIGDFYNEQVKPTIDKAPGFIQDFQPDRSFQYKPQDIAKGPVNIPLATVQRGLDTSKSGRDLKRGFDSFFQSSPQWAGGLLKSQYEQDPTRLPMLPGVPQSMASVKNPFISQGQEQRLKGIQGNVVGGINTVQQKNAEYIAKSDLSKQESRNDLAKNVGQGGASLVTAAGITLLSKNPQVGTSLAGLAFGGMKKGQVYDEARAAGLSPEQSDMVSTAAGATEALLEKVGMDIFLNRFGTSSGISNFVANSIIKATSEGLQEGLQEFGSNAWAKLTYDQQRSLLDGVFESAFIGAILGGAGGGSASNIQTQAYQQARVAGIPKAAANKFADSIAKSVENPGLTIKIIGPDGQYSKAELVQRLEKQADQFDIDYPQGQKSKWKRSGFNEAPVSDSTIADNRRMFKEFRKDQDKFFKKYDIEPGNKGPIKPGSKVDQQVVKDATQARADRLKSEGFVDPVKNTLKTKPVASRKIDLTKPDPLSSDPIIKKIDSSKGDIDKTAAGTQRQWEIADYIKDNYDKTDAQLARELGTNIEVIVEMRAQVDELQTGDLLGTKSASTITPKTITTKPAQTTDNVGKVDVGKISLPQKQDGFDGYIGKKGERIKIGTAKEMSKYRPEEFAAMVMAGELKRVTPKTEPKTTKDIRITDTKEAKPTKQPTIETVEPATTKLTLREKARDTLLAKTHIEPLMTVRKKQGEKVAADIIKAIHNPDKQAHLFDQQTLAESEQTFEELKQEYNKMTPQDREDIMMSRGKPATKEGQAIQRDAIARLKAKGIDPKSIEVDEVSKYVGTRLSKISDVELLEDYVYGTYKFTKSLKEYIQRYKNTTEKYTKKKFFVAPADAKAAGLELKDNNPVVNLESELMAIAAREGMINLKNDLENNSDGTYIMDADKAPLDWQEIHDPVFNGKRVAPEIAAVTNELISTNKTSQNKALKGVRVTNNLVRTTKFAGSGFHLGVEATQGLADIGLKDGLTGKQIGQITKWSSKQWDKQRKEDFYTRVVGNGGGDSYSIDVQAQTAFKRVVDKMMNTQGAGHLMKVPGVAFKVPSGFINWMFKTYIPMLKYAKVKQETAVLERKTGREISDPELQNIVREGQNFYGEMNERMFGRGATATSVLRFLFLAPGFAEGNIRTIIKGGTQKSAKRSRRNMLTSLMLHAIAGTVGTMAMTGKAPEPPEDLEDMRDLFKVDTGKVDDKGRKIMIDLLTYDKDYWEFTLGLFDEGLANMPKNTVDKVISRLNGMKAPMVDVGLDMAKLLTGEALVDWKGDRVYKVSDPLTQKILKTAVHEWDNVAPIALGTYQSARDKDASVLVATIEAFTGVRPAKTEKDKREQETLGKYWDLKDEQDELYYELYSSKTPQKDIEQYNGALDKLLESKLLDGDTRKDIEDSKIDVKEYWGNKLEMLTNENATQEDIDKVMKLKDNFDYSEQDVLNAFDDYLTQKREKGTAKNPSYSPDVGLEMDREDRLISLMGNGGQQSSVISDTLTDPLSSYNTSIQSKQFTADKYDLTQAKDVNGLVDLYTGRNEQLTAQMNAMDPIRDKADIISTQTLIKKNLASIAKLKANGLGGSGSSRAKRTLKVSGSSGNTNAISGQEKVSLSFKGLGGQSGKTATPKKRSGRL